MLTVTFAAKRELHLTNLTVIAMQFATTKTAEARAKPLPNTQMKTAMVNATPAKKKPHNIKKPHRRSGGVFV
jgi:hypothetical protein